MIDPIIGKTIEMNGQLYNINERIDDAVWATGPVQYKGILLPPRPDRQYRDINAFEWFPRAVVFDALKIPLSRPIKIKLEVDIDLVCAEPYNQGFTLRDDELKYIGSEAFAKNVVDLLKQRIEEFSTVHAAPRGSSRTPFRAWMSARVKSMTSAFGQR
jgi:hypothetical protein